MQIETDEEFTTEELESTSFIFDADSNVFLSEYELFSRKDIWLSFDDGPHPSVTVSILETLAEMKLPATFFMKGANARLQPELTRKVFELGHRVANHAYTHRELTKLSDRDVQREVLETEKHIACYMRGQKLFRAPYGDIDRRVRGIVESLGYRVVGWNVDTRDWDKKLKPTGWIDFGLKQVREGKNMVLMHDIQPTTAAHLKTFVQKLAALPNAKFRSAWEL